MTMTPTTKTTMSVRRLAKKEYLAFEELVASTSEGRAFLRQRDAASRVVATEKVRHMLQEIMPHLGQPTRASAVEHLRILRKELQEISAHIMQTRNEISALQPDQQGKTRIFLATTELDAIVSSTERATYDILNGAERIQAAAHKLPDTAEVSPIIKEISTQATEIMTACSFQDLTGQRITKVVNALRYVETRINAMIEIWGVDEAAKAEANKANDGRPDAHLLNGPTDEAADQSKIDSLFDAAPSPATDQNTADSLFK